MKENNFKLIETMLCRNNIEHLHLHLARLEKSAGHFKFRCDVAEITDKIHKLIGPLNPDNPYRVRLLLSRDGHTEITTEIVDNLPENYRITISGERTESSNDFLYHKTTNRNFYNSELARAREKGFFDIIFMNERGEITEGAVTNIYIEKEGVYITPPLSSGLLPGTIRTHLIQKRVVVEEVFFMDDLKNSDEVLISNAVIGFQPVANSGDIKFL
jgi:para-aminobenzoate synthetase/4-amino-4-deoxychorismate lyase